MIGSEQLYSEASSLLSNLPKHQLMVDLEGQLPSDISNIEEVSEQAACKLAMEQLQEQIELGFFHMQKKHQCIQDVAGVCPCVCYIKYVMVTPLIIVYAMYYWYRFSISM